VLFLAQIIFLLLLISIDLVKSVEMLVANSKVQILASYKEWDDAPET
jgi:hypothetical protein